MPHDITSAASYEDRATTVLPAAVVLAELAARDARIEALETQIAELQRAPARQQWKDRREAAEYLRCHPSTIDDMAASGRLPKHLLGTKPLYRVNDLDALADRQSASESSNQLSVEPRTYREEGTEGPQERGTLVPFTEEVAEHAS